MRRAGLDDYDEARVAAISGAVAAAIDSAALGAGGWDAAPRILVNAFPGAWGALWCLNYPDGRMNSIQAHNLEPAYLQSLADHFSHVNPWQPYWSTAANGSVALSEKVAPARLFEKNEFIADWLRPQGDFDAACGLSFVGDAGEAIQFIMHFSPSAGYDEAAERVLGRVRGNFKRAIDLARLLRSGGERDIALTALVERGRCAAFVVGADRYIQEANGLAEQLFGTSEPLIVRNSRCFLTDKAADVRFGAALNSLLKGIPMDGARITFRTASGPWQISLASLPSFRPDEIGPRRLLPARQLVLVLVNDLRVPAGTAPNLSALAGAFALTPAEIRMCEQLMAGRSPAEIADIQGTTVGTARTRLKMIFAKTGTSRQAELVLLLSRLS
jgi:DNA-binding CsgD family transcriptional regulator/PAS domain-containing protein